MTIRLTVDGHELQVSADAATSPLAEALRAGGHTAVKVGCQEGACGACTVLIDGRPLSSCLVPAARAEGASVETATGLTERGIGAQLARELARRGALQCGYCIPGLVASATALLADERHPDRAAIAAALVGHLCRCTGYPGLLDAVERTVAARHG